MTMVIRKLPDDEQVFFKVDGQRFKNMRTVKLHLNTTYRFEIVFAPPQTLESFSVHGSVLPMEEKTRDRNQSTYVTHWKTDAIPVTKKGEREQVPIIMKVTDKGTLRTSLQAKMYKADDTHHCEWGNTFSWIEYECNANEHRNHVDVAKETFR